MLENLPDGSLTWTMNFDDEKYRHRNRYIVNKETIEHYGALFMIEPTNYPNMPKIAEEAINAMSFFSSDSTVIDQAAGISSYKSDLDNEGLERKWVLWPKSIKTIEPRKEECKIYLKEFLSVGCLDTTADDFDAILDFVLSVCPKASFGNIVKKR